MRLDRRVLRRASVRDGHRRRGVLRPRGRRVLALERVLRRRTVRVRVLRLRACEPGVLRRLGVLRRHAVHRGGLPSRDGMRPRAGGVRVRHRLLQSARMSVQPRRGCQAVLRLRRKPLRERR
jgi:hypothetical protein